MNIFQFFHKIPDLRIFFSDTVQMSITVKFSNAKKIEYLHNEIVEVLSQMKGETLNE